MALHNNNKIKIRHTVASKPGRRVKPGSTYDYNSEYSDSTKLL